LIDGIITVSLASIGVLLSYVKISMMVSDASTNCMGRTYILAKVLSRHFEIELVGPLLIGKSVWTPFDGSEFECMFIPSSNYPLFFNSVPQILDSITGDVVYALKPLASSFGLALLSGLKKKRPIVLDIDDWEVGFVKWRLSISRLSWLRFHDVNWIGWTYLLDELASVADRITVSNEFLGRRYGGTLVPHGRDVSFLDPTRYDAEEIRSALGFSTESLVMFLGSPERYKGLQDLVEAVKLIGRKDVKLLIIGVDERETFVNQFKPESIDVLKLIGPIPLQERPKWLAAADVVVIPQRRSVATVGQMPAKLFDAMAMGKPIVATNVSDIPSVLQGCGLVVPAGDVKALSKGISNMLEHPLEAAEMGRRARQKCVEHYSWEAMERMLLEVFSTDRPLEK
jgi:glycosyltransferase involved in cell wall biosynthesis